MQLAMQQAILLHGQLHLRILVNFTKLCRIPTRTLDYIKFLIKIVI